MYKYIEKLINWNTAQKDIIVFSHLRWEFVTQRPQHILTRLARNRRIIFVEEPVGVDESKEAFNIIKPNENVTIIQPRIEWENFPKRLAPLLVDFLGKQNIHKPILWFYSPAFEVMTSKLDHSLVVYDCMDQLSAFKGASQSLITQEKLLLNAANLVFTGGKSLCEEKMKYHDNVYCFPSSVDRKHFERATWSKTIIPKDMMNLNKPIVGFYGVVDERFDLGLLDEISQRMADVTFAVIGPVVKIEEDELPRRNNIKYFGGRKYEDLPNYLKAIDITMMPFALNKSTQFISPTKTLEFMAALKPIISTPIYDVVRDYSKEVKIVKNAQGFEEAIRYYLAETSVQRYTRETLQKAVLKKTSWDKTVEQMKELIDGELTKKANNAIKVPTQVGQPVITEGSNLSIR